MRLSIATVLLLLLVPSLSWGGAASKLRGVIGSGFTITANSINGISSISSSGTTDTGTGSGGASGNITVAASCTGGVGLASVYLVVTDGSGSRTDSLLCDWTDGSKTLTATVTAPYTARVYGTKTASNTFTAGNFSFPQ